jgi:hypothetical protein
MKILIDRKKATKQTRANIKIRCVGRIENTVCVVRGTYEFEIQEQGQ